MSEIIGALRAPSFQQDSQWHHAKANYATKPRDLLDAAADRIERMEDLLLRCQLALPAAYVNLHAAIAAVFAPSHLSETEEPPSRRAETARGELLIEPIVESGADGELVMKNGERGLKRAAEITLNVAEHWRLARAGGQDREGRDLAGLGSCERVSQHIADGGVHEPSLNAGEVGGQRLSCPTNPSIQSETEEQG